MVTVAREVSGDSPGGVRDEVSPPTLNREGPVFADTTTGDWDFAAASRVLSALDPADRALLARRCVERRYGKGQVVYCEGESADSMLILTAGQLKVSSYSSDGVELLLSMVFPGETVGELGMLSHAPRSATVTATVASETMTLSRAVVMELMHERPAVAVAMLEHLADMARKTTGFAADLVFLDLSQRVAKFLLAYRRGSSDQIRITQAELASAIGASRQRVNACLQEFQRKGWITLASKSIRLDDVATLSLAVDP
jgi:CRP-like cAMP-binding protein